MSSPGDEVTSHGDPMIESPPSTARCSTFRLSLATGLTLCLVCAELSVGHHSRCLTLLALSDQTVYNLLTLIVALVANQVTISHSFTEYHGSGLNSGN